MNRTFTQNKAISNLFSNNIKLKNWRKNFRSKFLFKVTKKRILFFYFLTDMQASIDILLNGLSISAEGELELQSLCCMMGKTMSPFGC